MIRSLRTGITGLQANQTRMDVIGNNIANVNTHAFKRGRAAFAELLGQQLVGVGRQGGGSSVNPAEVGMGAAVSSIDRNWNQGGFEFTNIGTDLSINGEGFFIAREAGAGERNILTRAGNFSFNDDGQLVTPNGLNVQGWRFGEDGSLTTGAMQDVALDLESDAAPKETNSLSISGNLSADGVIGENSGETSFSATIYDGQGVAHKVVYNVEKTDVNEWEVTGAYISGDPNVDLTLSDTTITFDNDGNMSSPAAGANGRVSITANGAVFPNTGNGTPGSGDDVDFTMDITGLTQLGGTTTAVINNQDGQAAGSLEGYSISNAGILTLNYSNGQQRPLYQLGIGDVANEQGLEQIGENFYAVTSASGDLVVGRAQQEMNADIVSGALELSNVDLAQEFTDMIVTQRGYQASARVITTSDEILQEIVQLKR